jgi:hypothetical protein
MFGKHQRSKGQVRREGAIYVSVCRTCGVPMRRISAGKWVVRTGN